jgi:hypothetical protein
MNESKKILFVGHFSSKCATQNFASSAAGDIVQKEIISSINSSESVNESHYIAQEPMASWPKGPLYVQGSETDEGHHPSFLNIPVLKSIIFCIQIFVLIIIFRPNIIIQYNSYFFENLVLKFSTLFGTKVACIIQDVRIGNAFKRMAVFQDYLANKILKSFDYVVPVSKPLAEYLCLEPSKYEVFEGGGTSFGHHLKVINNLENFAVFAGALESHNGIDKLVDYWDRESIEMPLHIMGRGTLTGYIERISNESCNNIFYHGYKSQEEVLKFQEKAKFNFCFRYSIGLNQDYFFPSKFFNIGLCQGGVICNQFNGLPNELKNEIFIANEDFSNLGEILSIPIIEIKNIYQSRYEIITEKFNWKKIVNKILLKLEKSYES